MLRARVCAMNKQILNFGKMSHTLTTRVFVGSPELLSKETLELVCFFVKPQTHTTLMDFVCVCVHVCACS